MSEGKKSVPASPVMPLPIATSSTQLSSHSKKDIPTIVKSMKANVKNSSTCKEYIVALNTRLFDPDDKGSKASFQKFILNTTGGIAALLASMDAHTSDATFSEAALVFLYNLIHQGGKKNLRVITKIIKRGGSRTVLAIINKNAQNIRVVHSAAVVVVAIATSDSKMAAAARLSGCLANLLGLAKLHTTIPKEAVAGILCCICSLSRGEMNQSHLGKKGAVAIVLDIIGRNVQKSSSPTLQWAVKALVQLVSYEENTKETVKEGGVSLMLNALYEQCASVETQKLAMEVLRLLVKQSEGATQFASSGGYSYVVNLVIENNADKSEQQLHELVLQLYRLHEVTELPVGMDNDLYWEPVDEPEPTPQADDAGASDAVSPVESDANGTFNSADQNPTTNANELPVPLTEFSPELSDGFINPDTSLQDSVVVHHVKPFTDPRPSPSCPSAIDFVPPVEELLLQTSAQRVKIVRSQLRRLTQTSSYINRVVFDDLERDTTLPPSKVAMPSPSEASSGEIPPLKFGSSFECGNLKRAIQVFDDEYDLILNTDINTTSFIQWFYFSIENARSDVTYKFNIINMEKPASMFSDGQRVLLFSEKRFMWSGFGWLRTGHDIAYLKNSYKRRGGKRKKDAGSCHYTLTFSIRFPHDEDRLYITNCYPYSYSDLIGFLRKIQQDKPGVDDFFMAQNMCQTQCGNATPLLTITTLRKDGVPCSQEEISRRHMCVISARVHPGESNASYVAKGLIEYLLDNTEAAQYLRNNFVFKVIPMLNPDGVVNGNHRCALSGKDLNREFLKPDRRRNPTIYYLKTLCKHWKEVEQRNLILYGDFHGHSRRKNMFIFGCSSRKLTHGIVVEKVFPRMLEELCPYFSYDGCGFKVQRAKRMTGRVVFWREIGVRMSFTLEGSMMGGDFCDFLPVSYGDVEEDISRRSALARGTLAHFSTGHFCTMGAMFAKTIMLLHQGEAGLHNRANEVISDLIAEANGEKGGKSKSAARSANISQADSSKDGGSAASPSTPLGDDLAAVDEKASMSGSYAVGSRRGSVRKSAVLSKKVTAKNTASADSIPYTASVQELQDVYKALLRAGPAGATAKIAMSEGGGDEESDADNDDNEDDAEDVMLDEDDDTSQVDDPDEDAATPEDESAIDDEG